MVDAVIIPIGIKAEMFLENISKNIFIKTEAFLEQFWKMLEKIILENVAI